MSAWEMRFHFWMSMTFRGQIFRAASILLLLAFPGLVVAAAIHWWAEGRLFTGIPFFNLTYVNPFEGFILGISALVIFIGVMALNNSNSRG